MKIWIAVRFVGHGLQGLCGILLIRLGIKSWPVVDKEALLLIVTGVVVLILVGIIYYCLVQIIKSEKL